MSQSPASITRILDYGSLFARLFDRHALKIVALIFVATRVCMLVAVVASSHFPLSHGEFYKPFPSPLKQPLWDTWDYWDTTYYADIAKYGYLAIKVHTFPAFFPLYPLAMRLIGDIIGGNYYLAGLIITNVAWFVALYQLFILVQRDFGERFAPYSVLALSLFPTAFFGFVAYPESLLLALSLSCFLAIRQGKWLTAACLGVLAVLTRQAGLLLVLPFLWEYAVQHDITLRDLPHWQQLRGKLTKDLAYLTIFPLGIVGFGAWLALKNGDFLAFLHAQASWHRTSKLPIFTLVDAVRGILVPAASGAFFEFRSIQEFVTVIFVGVLCALCWRLLPPSYALYTTVLYLLFLSQPVSGFPLLSQSRFALELFPVFIVLGIFFVRHRALFWVYAGICFPLQLYFLASFSHDGWII